MTEPPARALTLSIQRDGVQLGVSTFAQPIVKIGRHVRGHVELDDPTIDRMHAVIEVTDDEAVIIDLGSAAGTMVNGSSVNKASLKPGDEIGIGPFRLRVESLAAPARPEPATPPRAAPAPATPRVPSCARCGTALVEAALGGGGHAYRDLPIRALRCAGCAITYVDVSTLERKLRRTVRITGTAAERSRKRGKGSCPLCATSLDRVSLEWAGSWATIEECEACGLLVLEQGELAVIERLAAMLG